MRYHIKNVCEMMTRNYDTIYGEMMISNINDDMMYDKKMYVK